MEPVELATFNIHHGEGRDGRVDLTRTAAAIAATGADLVALQEVDRNMMRSGRVDQPRELEELLGMHVQFFPTLERGEGHYGVAIASREPLDEARFVPLPGLGPEEPRGALLARTGGLRLCATHLSTQRAVRRIQLPALCAIAAGMGAPAVVLGDLNESSRGLSDLTRAGFSARAHVRGTLAARPWRQIDHICAGPGLSVEGARAIRTDASDHLPLVARIVGH